MWSLICIIVVLLLGVLSFITSKLWPKFILTGKKDNISHTIETLTTSTSATPSDGSDEYDVFISFRGEDTRWGFISHLYAALCGKQIKTYKDDVSLRKGEQISPALYQAIENSKISIVVFSKDYASSRYCLDELVHILKCKKERGHVILPVFFGVDPSDVGNQSGSFKSAFSKHEEKKLDPEKVAQWRSALVEASTSAGWDLASKDNSSEYELVSKIVKETERHLENICSITSDGDYLKNSQFVGIEKRLNELELHQRVDPLQVCVVGLWGMGGIGKSTLAKAAMRRLSSAFKSSFFVNVSEEVTNHGLSHLKNLIFKRLLKEDDVDADNPFTFSRLGGTKVCLVLDNVNEELFENENQPIKSVFGPGSIVILTSRDEKLLKRMGADHVNEVKMLDKIEAAQLFSHKAFRGEQSTESEYMKLSKRVVAYCGGNPLALNVLGSYLHSRSVREWESALKELGECPNENIQAVLKISYDVLNSVKKSIFLDIACFFRWEKRQIVEDTLGGKADLGISVLAEQSLLSINEDSRLQMHDLIQEMAWEVVRRERTALGKPKRLWDAQDVCSVLESNKGSANIEGISLDMSNMSQDLPLEPTVFEPMENLRILKIYRNYGSKSISLHKGLEHLPDFLQYLEWKQYPLKTLPMKFKPKNLVSLQMEHSKLEKLWNGVVHLGNLKHINLRDSNFLVELPDLSEAPKLETVDLYNCTALHRFPKISNSLKIFRMTCSKVEKIDSLLESLKNLHELNLSNNNLTTLPKLPENLTVLDLSRNNLETMPFLKHMSKLKLLNLMHCKSLTSLKKLPSSLRLLNVSDCVSLKTIDVCACTLLNGVNAERCTSLTHLYVDESVSASKDLHERFSKVFPGLDEAEYNYLWNRFTFNQCDKLLTQQSIRILLQRLQFALTDTLRNDLLLSWECLSFGTPPWGHACYPGKEIPEQFDEQSKGSEIKVQFPQNDSNIGCIGYFVSVLIRFYKVPICFTVSVDVSSMCDSSENSLESVNSDICYFEDINEGQNRHISEDEEKLYKHINEGLDIDISKYLNRDLFEDIEGCIRDHVVMWFIPFRVPPEKTQFKFSIDCYDEASSRYDVDIKSCGNRTRPLCDEADRKILSRRIRYSESEKNKKVQEEKRSDGDTSSAKTQIS